MIGPQLMEDTPWIPRLPSRAKLGSLWLAPLPVSVWLPDYQLVTSHFGDVEFQITSVKKKLFINPNICVSCCLTVMIKRILFQGGWYTAKHTFLNAFMTKNFSINCCTDLTSCISYVLYTSFRHTCLKLKSNDFSALVDWSPRLIMWCTYCTCLIKQANEVL